MTVYQSAGDPLICYRVVDGRAEMRVGMGEWKPATVTAAAVLVAFERGKLRETSDDRARVCQKHTGDQMKALTIIQPFALLITLPDSHPMHKRVENRTWAPPKSLLGATIAIHAGAARKYGGESVDVLAKHYELDVAAMPFGAVVATAVLVDAVSVDWMHNSSTADPLWTSLSGKPVDDWIRQHKHMEGPWGWVLADVRPLPAPLPWKGAQGLWEMPAEAITKAFAHVPAGQ